MRRLGGILIGAVLAFSVAGSVIAAPKNGGKLAAQDKCVDKLVNCANTCAAVGQAPQALTLDVR